VYLDGFLSNKRKTYFSKIGKADNIRISSNQRDDQKYQRQAHRKIIIITTIQSRNTKPAWLATSQVLTGMRCLYLSSSTAHVEGLAPEDERKDQTRA
jgi:hypothetical protein